MKLFFGSRSPPKPEPQEAVAPGTPSQAEILKVLADLDAETPPLAPPPAAPRAVPGVAPAQPSPTISPLSAVAPAVAPAPASGRSRDVSLYKSLLAGLYDGVLIFDAKGFVIGSNKRVEQFFGYTEGELWNKPCDKLIAAVNVQVLSKINAYVETGRFTVVNAACTRKDGTTFPAEIAISRIHLLHDGDFIFSIRNLERREKARERRELEDDALRCAGAGIAVCNTDGLIEYVNPAFVRLLHAAEEKDVIKRFIGDFCASADAALALVKTPSTQGSWFGHLALRTVDGKPREVLATAGACPAKRDAPARVVLTLTALPVTLG